MNLGGFIDTFRDAIAQRVVESYPTARGAAHFLRETVGRMRYAGAQVTKLPVLAVSAQITWRLGNRFSSLASIPFCRCRSSYPQGIDNPVITPSILDAGFDQCHTPS